MKIRCQLNKLHIVLWVLALAYYGITFVTASAIFTEDALAMNSLPIDTAAVPLMKVLTKLGALGIIALVTAFLSFALQKGRRLLLACFAGFFLVYAGLLLCNYPGYFMSDDTIIFGYATRYYPVYWHSYLTSLYYTIGMTLFPASTGPILLQDLILAMVMSYIVYETKSLIGGKKSYLMLILGLCPFVLLSAIMCFRPVLYAPIFLFFYAYLFFEYKKHAPLTACKLLLLAALSALLCLWRSEGIVLAAFNILLIPGAYRLLAEANFVIPGCIPQGDHREKQTDAPVAPDTPTDTATTTTDATTITEPASHSVKSRGIKRVTTVLVVFMLCFTLFYTLIKLPQSAGEEKYYGSDYLIIATIRPLSLIIQREQTYEGAAEDLANIDAVISLDYISYETLSCSSYHRYCSDANGGLYTQTLTDAATQSAYLKSAARLIWHNLDLYLAERLQQFLVTNGIYHYDTSLTLGYTSVITDAAHLHEADNAYGSVLIDGNKRLSLNSDLSMAYALFTYGGEALLFVYGVLLLVTIFALVKKQWLVLIMTLSLWAREAVIFLTAPASFIQYNYPTMYVAAFLALAAIVFAPGKSTMDAAR